MKEKAFEERKRKERKKERKKRAQLLLYLKWTGLEMSKDLFLGFITNNNNNKSQENVTT